MRLHLLNFEFSFGKMFIQVICTFFFSTDTQFFCYILQIDCYYSRFCMHYTPIWLCCSMQQRCHCFLKRLLIAKTFFNVPLIGIFYSYFFWNTSSFGQLQNQLALFFHQKKKLFDKGFKCWTEIIFFQLFFPWFRRNKYFFRDQEKLKKVNFKLVDISQTKPVIFSQIKSKTKITENVFISLRY